MSELRVGDICDYLDRAAPAALAESWDNVGLLVGDRHRHVAAVMTCLTITADSAAEAIAGPAQLVVSHHPLPFRPLSRITAETTAGRLLLTLIEAGVAVYSAHTAYDGAGGGINELLAERLGLSDVRPLVPSAAPGLDGGAGRIGGTSSVPLGEFVVAAKRRLGLAEVAWAGQPDWPVRRVGVACGSGGALLDAAGSMGCDVLVTGETSFHTCLEGLAQHVGLILLGHFFSERFAMELLAQRLRDEFPALDVWASAVETDPIRWA